MDDRRPLLAVAAAVCASVAAWCSLGTLTLSSVGPTGQRIGVLPPFWLLAAFVIVAVSVVGLVRPRRDAMLPWFSSASLLLPWLPLPLPTAVLAVSGPVIWLVWASVVASALVAAERPVTLGARWGRWVTGTRAPIAASVIAAVVYVGASWQTSPALPGGDEPHYLIITQSLLSDGDLRIENNHARRDYAPYFRGVLRPDYLRRGQDGEIYSIHLPGVSVLVAPAFALGGYYGVRLWLALLAALAAGAAWRMARQIGGSAGGAWFATAATAFTVPWLLLTFTAYPDGPAGVVVVAAVASLAAVPAGAARPLRWWAAAGALVSTLPWLHARYAVLALAPGAIFAARALVAPGRWRALAAFVAVPVASASAWFGYYLAIYGDPNPAIAYGHYTQMAVSNVARGLPGLFFDQQFGLVAMAPVYVLAFAGVVPLLRHNRRLGLEWLVVVVPYTLVTAMYVMWWGGTSSPARFLGPVMLLGALPIAAAWNETTGAAGRTLQAIALGVSLGLAAIVLGVEHGRLGFSFRDGFAQWAVWASTLADVARALPSWFRSGWMQGLATAGVWVAASAGAWLLARWLSSRRSLTRGNAALLCCTSVWVAAMAAAEVSWRMEGSRGVRPTSGQLAVIRALAAPRVPTTVSYDPWHVGEGRQLAHRVRLGGVPSGGGPDDAWLSLPTLPAGRYQVWLDNRRAGAAIDLSLRIGRSGKPAIVWSRRDMKPGPRSIDLNLPVDVRSLAIGGSRDDRDVLRGLWIQPVEVTPRVDRVTDERAIDARLYAAETMVWALDVGAYLEDEGLWIAGGSDVGFVVEAGETHRPGRLMRLRAGAVPVTAEVRSGSLVATVALGAGESREVAIPLARTGVALVRVKTNAGFRPSDLDRESRDERYLGVWIEFP